MVDSTTPKSTDRNSVISLEEDINIDGCLVHDHIIDADDNNYMSPEVHSLESKIIPKNSHLNDDLEHFWRNKDLILKDSKIPEIKGTKNRSLYSSSNSVSDIQNLAYFLPFDDGTSRYIKEKMNCVVNLVKNNLESNAQQIPNSAEINESVSITNESPTPNIISKK